ncbi:transposase, partial [Agrobacterium sp. DKPNP3]|uniref:transposase n=1 Tax=Agrobacterium sp. DKPNP3 TaxID=3457323 RepID=UPI0040447693
QYACGAHSELLHRHGIQPSMSRVGNPYDNAKAESFMKTLKQEEVQGLAYRDVDDARKRIGVFIDTVYNTQRLHSALDYLTPRGIRTEAFLSHQHWKCGIEEGELSAISLSHPEGALHRCPGFNGIPVRELPKPAPFGPLDGTVDPVKPFADDCFLPFISSWRQKRRNGGFGDEGIRLPSPLRQIPQGGASDRDRDRRRGVASFRDAQA